LRRNALAIVLVLAATALLAVPAASASRYIQHGIFDDAQINYGNPDKVFPTLKQLNVKALRVNLWWGGPNGVARSRPASPTSPADPAYNWDTYDRTVRYAYAFGMQPIFTVIGTPTWANPVGWNTAPKSIAAMATEKNDAIVRLRVFIDLDPPRLPVGDRC